MGGFLIVVGIVYIVYKLTQEAIEDSRPARDIDWRKASRDQHNWSDKEFAKRMKNGTYDKK